MTRKAMYLLAIATVVAVVFIASTPLRAYESDAKIASSFKKTYVYETYLKNDAIKVEAKEGIVTLTGTVAEESHKSLARDAASSLPGVARVDNLLTTRAEAVIQDSDAWIGRKVELALMLHRSVEASNITVEVNGGFVTLKGEAFSQAQRELTADYARDIVGVKDVKNDMIVVASQEPPGPVAEPEMDDASINAHVRAALSLHRSTADLKLTVAVQDGEVTLGGIARNSAEKELVTSLLSDIQGVVEVNNQMTVENP